MGHALSYGFKMLTSRGFQFTQKLEGMFTDMRISNEGIYVFRNYQNRHGVSRISFSAPSHILIDRHFRSSSPSTYLLHPTGLHQSPRRLRANSAASFLMQQRCSKSTTTRGIPVVG